MNDAPPSVVLDGRRLTTASRALRWSLALGALAIGAMGAGAFDEPIGGTWLIVTIAIHVLPAIGQIIPSRPVRIAGAWLGAFLIAQALLTPLILGDARHHATLPPNLDQTIDVVGDAIPGIEGPQRVTTDEQGFRVQPPVDYTEKTGFRIFAIGASTTEQILLDDRATWTHRLQEQLAAAVGRPIEVINTGLSGTRALNHLATFRHILGHKPDCALFLVGVNDWNKQIREHFGSDHYQRRAARHRHFKRTLLGRALRAVGSWVAGSSRSETGEVYTFDGSYYRERNDSLSRVDQRRLSFDAVAPSYRATIEEIGNACHQAGVPCVFMTQPHGYALDALAEYRRYFWMTPPNETYTLDIADLNGFAEGYNRYLTQFALSQRHGLIDLAAAVPGGTTFLYDEVHFNTAGARRVADVLTNELLGGACGPGLDPLDAE